MFLLTKAAFHSQKRLLISLGKSINIGAVQISSKEKLAIKREPQRTAFTFFLPL